MKTVRRPQKRHVHRSRRNLDLPCGRDLASLWHALGVTGDRAKRDGCGLRAATFEDGEHLGKLVGVVDDGLDNHHEHLPG